MLTTWPRCRCSGVEYGFMSTTLDRSVAEKYSKGNSENPSLILEMEMGMVNRGAFLGWISQYPDECEILLPPLTGLEVSNYIENADGALVYTMQLNINMQSMTIEQVLALRQKQCLELAEVVKRDLASHAAVGDIPQRQSTADDATRRIEAELDVNVFNDNARFVQVTEATLAQLPRQGDEMVSFDDIHTATVVCLAAGSDDTVQLISGGLDGAMVVHESADAPKPVTFSNQEHAGLRIPVLCVEVMHPLPFAAIGLFDHSVRITELASQSEQQSLVGHHNPVTALAWNPKSRWLASGSTAGDVVVWELDSLQTHDGPWMVEHDKCVLTGHTDAVRSLLWLESGLLASGSLDGTVRIVRVEKDLVSRALGGEFVQSLDRHDGPVTALATFPTSRDVSENASESGGKAANVLISASADRSMCVWDSTSIFELTAEVLKCHGLGICALVTFAQHRQLATASADATIKTWRLLSSSALEQLLTIRGHVGAVHSLCYIEARGWLASGGADKTIRLWRVDSSGAGSGQMDDDIMSVANEGTTIDRVQHQERRSEVEQEPLATPATPVARTKLQQEPPSESEPRRIPAATKSAAAPAVSGMTPIRARQEPQKGRASPITSSTADVSSGAGTQMPKRLERPEWPKWPRWPERPERPEP